MENQPNWPTPQFIKDYEHSRARYRNDLSATIGVQGEIARREGVKESEIETQLKQKFVLLKREQYADISTSIKLSDVEAGQIQWLWHRRIPFGKITILDGDPGMGKSLLAITIAAHLSIGRPMPGGPPDWGWQGRVLLIAPEDSAGDTVKPRMEAAGGDPSQIFLLNTALGFDAKRAEVYERPFLLPRDMQDLQVEIWRAQANLVIIDPLTAILDSVGE